jgi:hypothetical protein
LHFDKSNRILPVEATGEQCRHNASIFRKAPSTSSSSALLRRRLEISWKRCEAIGKGSTQLGSMINGESVFVWREGHCYDVEIVDDH